MLSSFIKIMGFIVSLFLFASAAIGAEIKADNYDIYLGDLDGDGDDDFYFQQKPWYLILHGEIATPIMVQTNFAINNNGGNYAAPVAFSLTNIDLVARVSSGALKQAIWNEDIFLVAQANGQNTLLLRGAHSSSPGLLLKSFSSSGFPTVAATYPISTYRGISDRGVTLRIIDVNGDDINDVVLGSFGSVDGETAYLADANNIHGQSMVVSAGVSSSGSGSLVGSVAGSFRVDESGSATYSIPISVPQGVAGVSPKVTINYSSQGGNGLVGYGASIAGLGAVSRCRQTLLQDGSAKPITWSAEDRFCLNGQRLMLVSSGSYGDVGSVYKTEIDSYVKVTAKGGSTGNPDYFEVEAKDGSKTFYGASQDSKLYTLANKLVHWAQSRFEDNMGNRIDYVYEGDYTTGQRIRYVYYAYPIPRVSSGYSARVEFNYGDRADISESYGSGGLYLKATKILNNVVAYNGSSIFRKYNFFYNEVTYSYVDNLSRLTSVEECTSDSSTSCYPRTRFKWGGKTVGFSSSGTWMNQLPSANKFKTYRFMDFNGDGRQDFLWVRGSGTTRYIEYGAINRYATGGISKQNFANGASSLTYTIAEDNINAELELQIIDYNNDGRQDLAICRPVTRSSPDCSSWDLYLSTPNSSGAWNLSNNKITLPFTNRDVLFGDINSDGVIDALGPNKIYLGQKGAAAAIGTNTYYSFSTTPSTFSLMGTPNLPATSFQQNQPKPDSRSRYFDYKRSMLGDVNGDGKVDLLLFATTTTPPCSAMGICHSSDDGYSSDSKVNQIFVYLNTDAGFVYSNRTNIGSATNADPAAILSKMSFKVQDINSDGLADIAFMNGIDWAYQINTGNGGTPYLLTSISSSAYSTSSIDLFDYNRDGYLDVVWHDKQNKQLKLRTWNVSTGRMGTTDTVLFSSKPADHSFNVGDMTGDGFADLIELKTDSNNNIDIGIFPGLGSATGLDKIYAITDGNGRINEINYGSLADSIHYTTLAGINTVTRTDSNYCSSANWTYPAPCVAPTIYSLDSTSFYTQLNNPFGANFNTENSAPALELFVPNYVVTQVSESAPTSATPANLNKVTYHYHHARMQAGGRGYLGYEKISTIDQQTGIKTETTYHQDWPFTGSPRSTVITTKEGHKLSEASNTWTKAADSSNSRVYRVMQDRVTETSYELKNNGTEQGSSLQTIATDTDFDSDGNVTRLEVVTSGQANTSTKITTNTYASDAWQRRMGRLASTTTATQRNGGTAVTRSSSFEYYGQNESWPGMLRKEIIEPGAGQLVTEYEYDSVGNKTITRKTANAGSGLQTRQTEVIYDSSKRFVETTRDGLNNVVSGVIQRHPIYGVPTQIRDVNGAITNIELNADGSERVRRDASGAGVITQRAYCDASVACPAPAKIRVTSIVSGGGKSTEYLDVLGRVVRSSKVMFDGRESLVDAEYDIRGRIARKSEPYFAGETIYWSTFTYDLVNRPLSLTAPDGTLTTTSYSGYTTTVTADAGTTGKKLARVETRNSLGNLVEVTDHLQGKINYGYDPLGNLTSATTSSNYRLITVQMCYDRFGRKIAMHDPDKGGFLGNAAESCSTVEAYLTQPASSKLAGWWFYKYNDFGELIEQTDTKRQVSTMEYDVLGRMLKRTDKRSDGSVDVHTRWFYDKYLGEATSRSETQLKPTAVVSSYDRIDESCSGSNYCQTYTYDSISRITDTVTYLPNASTGYITSVSYDFAGRAYKQYDVLNGQVQTSGTRTYFNSYGYAHQIKDIATGDVLQKTLSLNARGQVKEELRNNGSAGSTVYTYDNATGRLTNQNTSLAGVVIPIQNVTYTWDSLGNLSSRWNQSGNLTASGSTARKDLRESFCYDGLNRLIKSHAGNLSGGCNLSPDQQDQEYDGFGNITRKTNIGVYYYSDKAKHAVTLIKNNTSNSHAGDYVYDNNGNQISGAGRSIAYSTYDQPLVISISSATTNFKYGPDRARFERKDTKGGVTTVTNYLGNVERIQVVNSSVVEWKRYIAGAVYTVRTINGSVEKTNKSFLFNDHLGSLDVVTDAVGKVTHSASFNAWGERRSGENWAAAFASTSISLSGFDQSLTQRGYTGHEMLDDHGLIHMNGRIYDAKLARFLQADPFIQAAANTQSYNRYSYLIGNPLNATDPSGFFLEELTQYAIHNLTKGLVRGLFQSIGYQNSQILIGIGSMFCGPFAAACAAGATYDLNRAYGMSSRSSLISATAAGISSAAFSAIGSGGLSAESVFAAGAVGGFMAEMQGGNFGHGFVSAGLGAAAGATGGGFKGFIVATVVGGTVSEMTGGKFANGAASAAFSYAAMWGVSKMGAGGINTSDSPDQQEEGSRQLSYEDYLEEIKRGDTKIASLSKQEKELINNLSTRPEFTQEAGRILSESIASGRETEAIRVYLVNGDHYFMDTVKGGPCANNPSPTCMQLPEVISFRNWKLAFQWHPHPGGSSLPSSTDYITSKNQGSVPGLIWYKSGAGKYGVTSYKGKQL